MVRYPDARLLIVDDSRLTRQKLRGTLADAGYTNMEEAGSGEEALGLLASRTFDLFLLDILMPGMDGLELCRRIKAMPSFLDVPVLFVTGNVDMESQQKSFEAGGVDYIPKPFHPFELLARVATHLDLYSKQKANEKYAAEMESLAEARAQQLAHSERLSLLGVLTAGIVHEIRNALGVVAGNAQLMEKVLPEILLCVDYALEHGLEKTPRRAIVRETLAEGVTGFREGTKRATEIVENILRFSRPGKTGLEALSLARIVDLSLGIIKDRLKSGVSAVNEIPADLPMVLGRSSPLAQTFVNLFINATDAMKGAENAALTIRAWRENDGVRCTVSDNGCGMDAATLARLWDPFFTTKSEGTGLGLSITRRILEEMGGTISVESTPGKGTVFTLTLKVPSTA